MAGREFYAWVEGTDESEADVILGCFSAKHAAEEFVEALMPLGEHLHRIDGDPFRVFVRDSQDASRKLFKVYVASSITVSGEEVPE